MDTAQIERQIDLADFPADVQVTTFPEADGQVCRAVQGECGQEIVLTDEAARM